MHSRSIRKEEMEKVEEWIRAHRDVADMGGLVFRYEPQFIQENVEKTMIARNISVNFLLLEDESSEVGLAVIYGMGRIGKTTVSKFAYNLHFVKFQGRRLPFKYQRNFITTRCLVRLQKKLISDIQKAKEAKKATTPMKE
ncbi:hypothetical protein DVH24_035338 [Malus domestica]|uniref:NB-ARC domain-containing protein n=1 Tax=Malus domestica TaxID=3750 RepID=A0A498J8V1_MALDO|nr:hypothetical protein DVH24_035338 [Malus domestica]